MARAPRSLTFMTHHLPALFESQLRTRASYIALALGTIALGLGVHWRGGAIGPTLRDVLGDGLWAAMIAWWVGAVAPGASLRARALWALALCVGVEVSQLYHTTALDALRSTTAGHLVLGSDFDPRDLLAYALGVLVAVSLERALVRRHSRVAAASPPRTPL
jgi:Protein of unknown function (DUF2809)